MWCYRLEACLTAVVICRNLPVKVTALGGRACVNGISALRKRPEEVPSPYLPCEKTTISEKLVPYQTPNLLVY